MRVALAGLLIALAVQADPVSVWEGWWQHPNNPPGRKADRLLLTPGTEPGSLQVSGRAYWYGGADVVHYGQINGQATPAGNQLHIDAEGCALDLTLSTIEGHPELTGSDNGRCGGMNVSFAGEWQKFTPRAGLIQQFFDVAGIEQTQ
jgi:hypothetical protein